MVHLITTWPELHNRQSGANLTSLGPLCSFVLFGVGVSGALGVKAPLTLKSPDIYKPLFWGGLWGILFGLFIKMAWKRLYLVGFLYVLAPLTALFLFFLPKAGAGFFGLQ